MQHSNLQKLANEFTKRHMKHTVVISDDPQVEDDGIEFPENPKLHISVFAFDGSFTVSEEVGEEKTAPNGAKYFLMEDRTFETVASCLRFIETKIVQRMKIGKKVA